MTTVASGKNSADRQQIVTNRTICGLGDKDCFIAGLQAHFPGKSLADQGIICVGPGIPP